MKIENCPTHDRISRALCMKFQSKMLSNLLYARVEEESPVRVARLADAEGFVDVQRGDAGLVANAEASAWIRRARARI